MITLKHCWQSETEKYAEGLGSGLQECGDPTDKQWQRRKQGSILHSLRTWIEMSAPLTALLCDGWTHFVFPSLVSMTKNAHVIGLIVRIKRDGTYERAWLPIGTRSILWMWIRSISFTSNIYALRPSLPLLLSSPVLLQDLEFCVQGLPRALGSERRQRG